MKQKITFFKVFLTLMLLCGVSSAWAETATFVFNTDEGLAALGITKPSSSNGTDLGSKSYVIGDITMTATNGGTNTRVWNSSGTVDLRIYKNGSLTFSAAAGFEITQVAFTGSSTSAFSFPAGGTFQKSTWTGLSESITLTATGTNKINTITVTYSKATTNPVILSSDITIESDATSGEIEYSITNPVSGKTLSATTEATWISNIAVTSEKVTFDATKNTGDARTAQITLKYDGADDKVVKVTQNHLVLDYVTLPFEWAGGASSDFTNLDGVTTSGLGSDYAASNAPYLIKLDNTGDYFQFKTNEPIGLMSVDVKMLGGKDASSLKVQGSADGDNWSDIETLSISGKQNDVLNLKTTSIPDKSYRYVKFVFTKGSNVGVGAITINAPQTQNVDITPVGYATAFIPFNATISNEANDVKAYYVTVLGNNAQLNEIKGTIPANKGVVLKGSAGTVTFTESAGTLADVTDNKLIGTADKDGAIFAEDNTTYYILSIVDGKVGFYWDPNSNDGDAAICAQYKAVLAVLNTSAGAPSFFTFDDATAINAIGNVKASGVRYNLNGQAVGEDYKGIVIVNGKKMFNK